ncbi:hypothetical protein NEOKW01_0288 [Nematocida sp. AWRm80]|nr:hypothetical protein NEOKW01_0288 [Nematocida sp. AWRm80]
MTEKNFVYDKEVAKLFSDPYFHGVTMHIENIKKEDNSPETKREYIDGLESILVKQDISTAPSILPLLKECVDLMHTPEVQSDICVMLGHISQNVQPVALELVKAHVFKECMVLYKNTPATANKIIFLLTILNNTLPSLLNSIVAIGDTPEDLFNLSQAPELTPQSQDRLKVLLKSLQVPNQSNHNTK